MGKKICLVFLLISFSFAKVFEVDNTIELNMALKEASFNGESDEIILKKGVYKNPNNIGGFVFLDNEKFDLYIRGEKSINKKDIVLYGVDNQVLNYTNMKNSTLHISDLTLVSENKNSSVAGIVYSNQNINIKNCNIINKSSINKNLIYAYKKINVSNINIYND